MAKNVRRCLLTLLLVTCMMSGGALRPAMAAEIGLAETGVEDGRPDAVGALADADGTTTPEGMALSLVADVGEPMSGEPLDDAPMPDPAEDVRDEPSTALVAQAEVPRLSVTAHVQRTGWQAAVASGGTAGTTGENLRLEALRMSLSGGGTLKGSIQYRAHVQKYGWQGWKSDGQLAGTSGEGLRLEALRIRLSGDLATSYDLWYQVHVQDIGWMGLAKNGTAAGTVGRGLKIEAVRVWLVGKGASAPSNAHASSSPAGIAAEGLQVRTHVQNIGWQAPVGEGETAGMTGRSLRVEAFSLSTVNLETSGAVEYRSHVQDEGWQGWRTSDAVSGSVGKGRRVEAVQMRLTGELALAYDLYYRTYVQNIGWLTWAQAGAQAGSTGLGMRVEALQVRLVSKGSAAPLSTDAAVSQALVGGAGVTYSAYVQTTGWQEDVSDGATAGTTGASRRVEALRASIIAGPATLSGGISYRAHVQDIGWQDWSSNGKLAGTTGQSKRVESVCFKLTGDVAKTCSIWYRAYVQDVGWLGWARDGEIAGTTGAGKRLEAFQVKVLGVGVAAPGSTANHHLTAAYFQDAMTRKAQGYSSPTGQLIMVDLSAHRVGIYTGSAGNWNRIRLSPCSVGAPGSPTVRGVFSIGNRGYVFGSGYSCYYWTQFYGAYLFHSVLYYPGTFTIQDGRLGYDISHGCVRMAIDDARYINENIRTGTTVVVY